MNEKEIKLLQDDEIDLIAIIKTLWLKKNIIISVTFLAIVLTFITTKILPKQYQSLTSFHINEPMANQSLSNYTSLLGINTNSNLDNIIKSLINSNRIKENVAQKNKLYFQKEIKKLIEKEKLINDPKYITAYIINKLKLNKNLNYSKSKENLITLKYHSIDPFLSQKILISYINTIEKLNNKLEISGQKEILTIIDPPSRPLDHFKPNIILNILLSGIASLLLSSIVTLKIHHIGESPNNKNHIKSN